MTEGGVILEWNEAQDSSRQKKGALNDREWGVIFEWNETQDSSRQKQGALNDRVEGVIFINPTRPHTSRLGWGTQKIIS
jgi:hypothetical protein